MTSPSRLFVCLAALGVLAGCNRSPTYTLYRDSLITSDARIHWATFDAIGMSEYYNRDHCHQVRDYLRADQEVNRLNFWCEKGSYSK